MNTARNLVNPYNSILNTVALNTLKSLNESALLINEESYSSKPEILSTKPDVTIFKAILQEAEVPNRNKRIYTKKAIDEALHREMIVEKLQRKTWYGENGHPLEDTVKRQTYINQNNISHIITKYWWEGNILWGEVETANTRAGKDFQGLIRQGCGVSFSMRGIGGEVKKKDGYDYIDSGLFLLCYDNVTFPSHAPAYIQEIIKEDTNVLNESVNDFSFNGKSFLVNSDAFNSIEAFDSRKPKVADKDLVDNFMAKF